MGKKKRVKKTMPMRVLDGEGIVYEVHQHAHKEYTACLLYTTDAADELR